MKYPYSTTTKSGMLRGMESLGNLLSGIKSDEPHEVTVIKEFVMQRFQATPTVSIGQRDITIIVKGSALAGALRPHLFELQQLCATPKRLVIRIQ